MDQRTNGNKVASYCPQKTKTIELETFTNQNLMSLNFKKIKIQSLNPSRKYSYLPQIVANNEPLEVVDSFKILGIFFNSDCTWNDHVNFMVNKARQKTWMLRRLKSQGVKTNLLVELYTLFVRSGLEFAAPL